MYITNCTFAHNASRHFACAIMNSGSLTIANTLLDSNLLAVGPNNNVWAGVGINKQSGLTDGGGNLEYPAIYLNGSWTDSWLTEHPGVALTDPALLSLSNNGGPTKTMEILAGSSAVNGGTKTHAPLTDQRGITRTDTVDIGAYEYVP